MHASSKKWFWSELDARSKCEWQSNDRGPVGKLSGSDAGSERGWRTNELGRGRTENRGNFGHWNRQRGRGQNRCGCNRLNIEAAVSGSTDRASMMGGGRSLGMGMRGLHRPHHAHQADAEHTHRSDQYAPIYRCLYHDHTIKITPAPVACLEGLPLDDSIVRWSSGEMRVPKKGANRSFFPCHPRPSW